jgi:Xaa-Pro aminopeptidase
VVTMLGESTFGDKPKWPRVPYEEYRLRIDRAKQILAKHGIDAMLLFSPTDWWYYGGWTDVAQMHTDVWRSGMIVLQDRDPVAVVHMAYLWCLRLTTHVKDVRGWSDVREWGTSHQEFMPLLLDTIKDLDLSGKVIGLETGPEIDTYLSFDEYEALREALRGLGVKVVSADKAIWEQRMVKTPWEIDTIREGCRRGCDTVRTAFEAIKPGINEREVHRVFWEAALKNDLWDTPNVGTWLCFSSNASEAGGVHRWITQPVDRVIEWGDQGLCDCGPTYQGYQLDFQRNFYVGDPPEKQLKYYNIAKEAFLETVEAIKPGIQAGDIHAAAERALKKRDPTQFVIIKFVGHGEGLINHEPPWLIASEETVIQPGMVLAVEVGAFDLAMEVSGGMPEDVLLVTEDGIENLTRYLSHDLWIVR